MTSMRKPSTPRSTHQRIMAYTARRTSGFSQLRSGCCGEKRCRKYSPLASSSSHAGPENIDSQLFGSAPGVPGSCPGRGGRHQYQSRFGEPGSRDSTNHGWASEVWLTTRSMTSRMPRAWHPAMRASRSASVPKSGSTSW